MPQGEAFYNPYRWVQVPDSPVRRARPVYHHRFQGLAGSIRCRLTALTPLMIASGTPNGNVYECVTHPRTNEPFIPGTSLKGAVRALAEVVGNAAATHGNQVDAGHAKTQAEAGQGAGWELDIVARSFGFLGAGGRVYAGSIQFTDAQLVHLPSPRSKCPTYEVQVGAPRPTHRAFYPDPRGRKFYHHRPGATGLMQRPQGIDQFRTVRPMPPDTVFSFGVHFHNLSDDELNLLVYCLALEDDVRVTLSAASVQADPPQPAELRGPLRHKIGGCKPHGAGSVQIELLSMRLQTNMADRYRVGRAAQEVLDGDSLQGEVQRRAARYVTDASPSMQQLRAMLVYDPNDPRAAGLRYPEYQWFRTAGNGSRRLKPTN